MVQYTVALGGSAAGLANFPSALTLDGNGVSFTGSGGGDGGSVSFKINGNDMNAPQGSQSGVSAIGYTNSSDGSSVSTAATPSSNYVSPQNVPSVALVSPASVLQTISGLQSLVQSVTQNADLVINSPQTGAADQQSLPSAMSASNPMVVVVNGDFNLTHASGMSAFTGYGLLLVTGTLHYDPDDSWNGVILVIGKGVFDGSRNGKGGQINGAVLVAKTLDNAGNPLASLGSASFNGTGGGNGIQYSSSWVKGAQALMPYQVLSFREIPQTTP
jgi:hypothetical protein